MDADEVLLSSLGATLDLHGSWPAAPFLIGWDHRSTLGRDNYVRVETTGFLAPFRHPATIIDETYRIVRRFGILSNRAGDTEAILVQTRTLVVREPVADTSLEALRTGDGRVRGAPFPFVSVRCTQLTTTGLAAADDLETNGGVPEVAEFGGQRPLLLPFVGTDHNGVKIPFTSAVYFVPGASPSYSIAKKWNGNDVTQKTGPATRTAVVPKVDTALAPEHPDHPGLTTVPLVDMEVVIVPAPLPETTLATMGSNS